jgi:hypothetical protein
MHIVANSLKSTRQPTAIGVAVTPLALATRSHVGAGAVAAPIQARSPNDRPTVIPLALETRTHIPTADAAAHLLRCPQTMRTWAMTERGPIRPIRVGVRLMWPVADIRRLLGVA